MSKLNKSIVIIVSFVAFILFFLNYIFFYKTDYRVLHAGGLYKGETYTNSIEAFKQNGKEFKYFEIDFQLTKDKKLICAHELKKEKVTYEEFLNENKYKKIKSCNYQLITKWLKKNPNNIIITDIKTNNLEGLMFIKNNFDNYQSKFIPQIYNPDNFEIVKNMGYKNIIWTLYKYNTNKKFYNNIIKIIKNKKFFAITMPTETAKKGLSKKIKQETKTKILVHTVNFRRDAVKLIFLYGVTDIYTDTVLNDINNIFSWFSKKILLNE